MTAIAATRISASAPAGGSAAPTSASQPAMTSVAPVRRSESLTGMSAASMTRIGPSTAA